MEGDVTQLMGNDTSAAKSRVLRFRSLEHFHYGALRILECDHVVDGGLGILLARGPQAMRGGLLFERTEIVVGPELESDSRAFRMQAMTQDDGMMLNAICKIDHVPLFGDQR